MARSRMRPWDERRACRATPCCRSIAGHYGQCMLLAADGRLRWADGRLAIGEHPLRSSATKRRSKNTKGVSFQ